MEFGGSGGSCGNSEFYDPTSNTFTVAGGTSFAAPIFAGMVAILNQAEVPRQGLVNKELYSLAANSSTYSSAFHDVTSGSNACNSTTVAGGGSTTYCPSSSGYSAGKGYDLVTGLGSIDLGNLATAWSSTSTSAAVETQTAISATTNTPTVGASDTFTITVTADSGSTVPQVRSTAINGGTATS